jgi:hypothetical protein
MQAVRQHPSLACIRGKANQIDGIIELDDCCLVELVADGLNGSWQPACRAQGLPTNSNNNNKHVQDNCRLYGVVQVISYILLHPQRLTV